MIRVGEVNTLKVVSENKSGFLLDHPDDDECAFLPGTLAPRDLIVSDEIEVFITVDDKGSLLATTEIPNTFVGEFGFLKVIETQHFGAFMDWGVKKDLFIPENEQREKLNRGESYLVRVCIDERTEKIYGTTKINKYIQSSEFDIANGDEVQLVPVSKEELGYRCIINKKYIGMIYHNEIFQDIRIGRKIKGQVKKIRDDGLVDVSLQPQGIQNLVDSKEVIINYLKEMGGKSPLHDKSTPEEIKNALQMSKKSFKSVIGMLYKEKRILITSKGIELIKE